MVRGDRALAPYLYFCPTGQAEDDPAVPGPSILVVVLLTSQAGRGEGPPPPIDPPTDPPTDLGRLERAELLAKRCGCSTEWRQ